MKNIQGVITRFLALAAFVAAGHAAAQAYPSKPIKVIVPFSAGSGSDVMTRTLMEEVKSILGATIVVENKPGALGAVAAEFVAKSQPDGYTLLLGTSGAHSANQWLYKDLRYAPIKDFTPVARTTNFPFLLAVKGDGVQTVADFMRWVKDAPPKSMGYGNSTGQLAGAHFMRSAKFHATSVPYKSTPPSLVDLAGGVTDFMFVDLASSSSLLKSGRIRAVAVMADKPSTLMPGLPALGAEFPGFTFLAWGGLMGPAGLPQDIVTKLNGAVVGALNNPQIREKFASMGLEPFPSTPGEFATFLLQQEAVWGERIKSAGMKPE